MEISDDFAQYRANFIETVYELESLWNGQLGRITEAKHTFELSLPNARQNHSAPYSAGRKAQEFKKNGIFNLL